MLALSIGISPIIVMKRTGHSDYKAMMSCIDMEDAFKAESMTKFNGLFKNNDYLRVNKRRAMAEKKKDASVELSQSLRQLPAAWIGDSMGEIVIYNPVDTIKIEVRLGRESVWLTQSQLGVLFDVDRTAIVRHVGNIYRCGELEEDATCAKIAQVQNEGGRMVERVQKYYNLDMILSVGYRVNSRNATSFRRWANSVLKEYLLRGYAINPRLEQLEQRVTKTEEKIDFFVRTALPPVEGVFYDGQIFDAYEFASKLIKSAKKEIVLIDNYVDETVLTMLDKREPSVKATIYTKQISAQFQLDIDRHNAQYAPIDVQPFNKAHDRFLIIDKKVYHIGASLKDLGKKWFAFSLMQDLTPQDLISRI